MALTVESIVQQFDLRPHPEGGLFKETYRDAGTIAHKVLPKGHFVQYVMKQGYWFGAYPNPGSRFSFVGCTVFPGFDFADFEMGSRAALLKQFPHAQEVIERLTEK